MSFPAKWPGRCEACLARFDAGTLIRRSEGVHGRFEHADAGECEAAAVARALGQYRTFGGVPLEEWLANGVRAGSLTRARAEQIRELAAEGGVS